MFSDTDYNVAADNMESISFQEGTSTLRRLVWLCWTCSLMNIWSRYITILHFVQSDQVEQQVNMYNANNDDFLDTVGETVTDLALEYDMFVTRMDGSM